MPMFDDWCVFGSASSAGSGGDTSPNRRRNLRRMGGMSTLDEAGPGASSCTDHDDDDGGDPPRSLFQVLFPPMGPSLCVISIVLGVTANGLTLFERSAERRMDGDGGEDFAALLAVLRGVLRGVAPYLRPAPLLVFVLFALLLWQHRRLRRIVDETTPVPGVIPAPGAHPYMGHFGHMVRPASHQWLFRDAATPSGVSAMWGAGLKRCASVLQASHARAVLRGSSQRDFSNWLIRHSRRTLGEDSLILIEGGARWKGVRKAVARAFARQIVKDGRGVVGRCAEECVGWVRRACEKEEDDEGDDKCQGHELNEADRPSVCVEAEDFFKLFALNVFGRVAMDHDFGLFPTEDDSEGRCDSEDCCAEDLESGCTNNLTTGSNNSSNNSSNTNTGSNAMQARRPPTRRDRKVRKRAGCQSCTCLTTPPVMQAINFLWQDMGVRALPASQLNPAMQMYSIPTPHNRTYHRSRAMVNNLMGGIIRGELDRRLDALEQARRKRGSIWDDEDDAVNGGQDNKSEETPTYMLAQLTQSCIERHFDQLPSPRFSKRRHSYASQSSSQCPFSSSGNSLGTGSMSTSPAVSVPPRSQVTGDDKAKIVEDVTKILHTLLVAGYETTAISLSYAMYCLATHPRCQERCHEEARRVLGGPRHRRPAHSTCAEHDPWETADDDALPYCRAVFIEAIRIHNPVLYTTRVLTKDLTLDTGYDEARIRDSGAETSKVDSDGRPARGAAAAEATLLKGTRVHVNPDMVHRDERNFERATEFLPERWVRWDAGKERWVDRHDQGEGCRSPSRTPSPSSSLSPPSAPPLPSSQYAGEHGSADAVSAADPANFFSFSDGARNCVGRRMAVMEATMLIAALMRDLGVELGDKGRELVKKQSFVTVKPDGLPILFWKR
ncbi:hypothetical protein ACHAWF_006394 [Thalassiosira exigua]